MVGPAASDRACFAVLPLSKEKPEGLNALVYLYF